MAASYQPLLGALPSWDGLQELRAHQNRLLKALAALAACTVLLSAAWVVVDRQGLGARHSYDDIALPDDFETHAFDRFDALVKSGHVLHEYAEPEVFRDINGTNFDFVFRVAPFMADAVPLAPLVRRTIGNASNSTLAPLLPKRHQRYDTFFLDPSEQYILHNFSDTHRLAVSRTSVYRPLLVLTISDPTIPLDEEDRPSGLVLDDAAAGTAAVTGTQASAVLPANHQEATSSSSVDVKATTSAPESPTVTFTSSQSSSQSSSSENGKATSTSAEQSSPTTSAMPTSTDESKSTSTSTQPTSTSSSLSTSSDATTSSTSLSSTQEKTAETTSAGSSSTSTAASTSTSTLSSSSSSSSSTITSSTSSSTAVSSTSSSSVSSTSSSTTSSSVSSTSSSSVSSSSSSTTTTTSVSSSTSTSTTISVVTSSSQATSTSSPTSSSTSTSQPPTTVTSASTTTTTTTSAPTTTTTTVAENKEQRRAESTATDSTSSSAAAESTAETAAETTAETTAKTSAENTTKPSEEATTKSIAETATETAAETSATSAAESAAEAVAEPNAVSVTGSAILSTATMPTATAMTAENSTEMADAIKRHIYSNDDDLAPADIIAAWAVIKSFKGIKMIASYDRGLMAGAFTSSKPEKEGLETGVKYLEFFPAPEPETGHRLWPGLAPALSNPLARPEKKPVSWRLPTVPFAHLVMRYSPDSTADAIVRTHDRLLKLTREIQWGAQMRCWDYNVIMTSEWMAMIPRQRTHPKSPTGVFAEGENGPWRAGAQEMLGLVNVRDDLERERWQDLGYGAYLRWLGIPTAVY